MKGRKKALLAATLAAAVVLIGLMSATAAWSSSDTPTDRELFYKGTTSDYALTSIVDHLAAKGIAIDCAGVTDGDEQIYQVVLHKDIEHPALIAHQVWREAMLTKSRGFEVPPVEVFQFDGVGGLVFGFGQATETPKDVTREKEPIAETDASAAVSSLVTSLLADNSNQSIMGQVSINVGMTRDADSFRVATIALDFPADATNEELDEFVSPLFSRMELLNQESGTSIHVAYLELHRGTELVLEEILDYQMDAVSGWRSSSYGG